MALPTPAQLDTYISVDPDGLGLSWTMQNQQLFLTINAVHASYRHPVETRDKSWMTLELMDALVQIIGWAASADPTEQLKAAKWDAITKVMLAHEQVHVNHPKVDARLQEAVTDGLLTAAEVTAIQTDAGTNAQKQGWDNLPNRKLLQQARKIQDIKPV